MGEREPYLFPPREVTLPIGDSPTIEKQYFQYKKPLRDWWMRVANGKCQVDIYDEKKGWHQCNEPATEVHHTIPEAWSITHGMEAHKDECPGLPACTRHHSGSNGDEFTPNFSFHPDMGEARSNYHECKAAGINIFKGTADHHHELAKENIVFWKDKADPYYQEKMKYKATIYQLKHPNDRKPA